MKILVSGCSSTYDRPWPNLLFAPKKYEVLNVAAPAAGNTWISNSAMYHVEKYRPDFVYILWSGINRIDFRTPNSRIFKEFAKKGQYPTFELGNSLYHFSGHAVDSDRGWLAGYNSIKDPNWPEITCLQDWFNLSAEIKKECLEHKLHFATDNGTENIAQFCHQYFLTQHVDENLEYRSEITFQNMANCFNLLEKLKIPYRFSFIYDIWSKDQRSSNGMAVKEKYYYMIDWSKHIDIPSFNWALKHDFVTPEDGSVPDEGLNLWAGELAKQMRTDPELLHLFR
jgi:hypothetical protein